MNNANHIPDSPVTEASLLKRVAIFLEDGEFDRADEYCERVLDINVENGEAYLYKLLAKLKIKDKASLYNLEEPFDTEPAYAKIMRFAQDSLKDEIQKINASVLLKKEEREKAVLYETASYKAQSESLSELTDAYRLFNKLGESEKALDCRKKIESLYDLRYNELYLQAKEIEQEINNRQYQSSTDAMEKDDYNQYIKDNQGKKFFDYSFLAAACVAVLCIVLIFSSVSNYLSTAGISFKTVVICIITRIIPGMPLTGISTIISFRISKKLIKKQKSNLIEDIDAAAEKAKEISEKITLAESEAFQLKRELDLKLDELKSLNGEYDLFIEEKEKQNAF